MGFESNRVNQPESLVEGSGEGEVIKKIVEAEREATSGFKNPAAKDVSKAMRRVTELLVRVGDVGEEANKLSRTAI